MSKQQQKVPRNIWIWVRPPPPLLNKKTNRNLFFLGMASQRILWAVDISSSLQINKLAKELRHALRSWVHDIFIVSLNLLTCGGKKIFFYSNSHIHIPFLQNFTIHIYLFKLICRGGWFLCFPRRIMYIKE